LRLSKKCRIEDGLLASQEVVFLSTLTRSNPSDHFSMVAG
jgi:hypothetical protein